MSKMICAKCQVSLRPEENGVKVKEMFQGDREVYKIWEADLWQCPGCGLQIISGFGQEPIAEHFEDHFPRVLSLIETGNDPVFLDKERP